MLVRNRNKRRKKRISRVIDSPLETLPRNRSFHGIPVSVGGVVDEPRGEDLPEERGRLDDSGSKSITTGYFDDGVGDNAN